MKRLFGTSPVPKHATASKRDNSATTTTTTDQKPQRKNSLTKLLSKMGSKENISKSPVIELKKPITRSLTSPEGDLGLLDELPKEILLYIFTFFRPRELYSVFSVSRKMNYYACYETLWMSYFRTYFEDNSHPIPTDVQNWKQFFLCCNYWKWDSCPYKKADVIDLDLNNRAASRPTNKGSNPAVLAIHPLTATRNAFEVTVEKRGNWIGVGFCDESFVIHDAPTLGTQTGCINASFFCQDSTTLRIQSNKDKLTVPNKIAAGDRIKIKVNFATNEVFFYRNGSLEGSIVSEIPLEEGKLFPCANMSYGSAVSFTSEF